MGLLPRSHSLRGTSSHGRAMKLTVRGHVGRLSADEVRAGCGKLASQERVAAEITPSSQFGAGGGIRTLTSH